MEQASCCTSVKTGSNFNWIPRLDFIGRVPIRRGEETELAESGKFPARFLIVDPVSLSANREFLKRCSRRGKIDSRENFSMKEYRDFIPDFDLYLENPLRYSLLLRSISLLIFFLFFSLQRNCRWKQFRKQTLERLMKVAWKRNNFFRGTVPVNWKLDILLNFSCYVSARKGQSFEIVYFALTFCRKCSCRD